MKGKKGQIGDLQGIILTVVVVGLLIGSGLLINQEFRDQDSLSDTLGTVTNETGYGINDTSYTFDLEDGARTRHFVVTGAWNATNATGNSGQYAIGSGNYTIDADAGTIVGATARTANYSDVNVSYTYLYGETSWEGMNSSLEAMTTVPNLLGLIIIVALIGIVLAVLFGILPIGKVSAGA